MIPTPAEFRELQTKFSRMRDKFPQLSHTRIIFSDPQNIEIEVLRQNILWPQWKFFFEPEAQDRFCSPPMGNFVQTRTGMPYYYLDIHDGLLSQDVNSIRVIHFLHLPRDTEDIVDVATANEAQREFMILAEKAASLLQERRSWMQDVEQYLPPKWLINFEEIPLSGEFWLLFLHKMKYSTNLADIERGTGEPSETLLKDVFLEAASVCASLADNIERTERRSNEQCLERQREEARIAGRTPIEINLANFYEGESKNLLIDLVLNPCGVIVNSRRHGKKQPDNLRDALRRNGYDNAAKVIYKDRKTKKIFLKKGFGIKFSEK